MLSPELLNILVCPVCKGDLLINASQEILNCTACCLAFPVRNGIPVLLVDQAEKTA
jgi:uncharacterized protein YbaR (Trm112 family)